MIILADEEKTFNKIICSFVRKTSLIRNGEELPFPNKEHAWKKSAVISITLYRRKLSAFSL